MGYRKVSWIEQCWYIIKSWFSNKFERNGRWNK